MPNHEVSLEELQSKLLELRAPIDLVDALELLPSLDHAAITDSLFVLCDTCWSALLEELTSESDAVIIKQLLVQLHYLHSIIGTAEIPLETRRAQVFEKAVTFKNHAFKASLQPLLMQVLIQREILAQENTFTHFFMAALLDN